MPTQPIEAVIFDMDGVLADSEPLYHLSMNQVLQAHGHSLTNEDNRIILGTTVIHTWKWLKDRFGLDGELEEWIGVYDRIILKNLKENVEPSPGLYDLLDSLKARGLPIGLASSSQANWVDTVLTTLDVKDRFSVVVSGDMVTNGKPAPEIFLKAAGELGAEPSQVSCLRGLAPRDPGREVRRDDGGGRAHRPDSGPGPLAGRPKDRVPVGL